MAIYTAPTQAAWNFTKTAFSAAGYNNMVAGASSIGNLSSTDATTGWTLITNATGWELYTGSGFFALNNGEGGSSAGSPTYPLFTANALQGGFINAGHSFSGSTGLGSPFEFTNLPAGTYTLYAISSVKATIASSIPNNFWYCKVGSGSYGSPYDIVEASNNTTDYATFNITVGAGDHVFFGVYSSSESINDPVLANSVIIIKTS